MKYLVYLEPDEDGVFVATCPALPGCVSQGRTRAEASENMRKAMEGYLKSLRKHGDPVPPSILEEVIEVAGCEVTGRFRYVPAQLKTEKSHQEATEALAPWKRRSPPLVSVGRRLIFDVFGGCVPGV